MTVASQVGPAFFAKHWLFRLRGLHYGDVRKTETQAAIFIGAAFYVLALVMLTVLWAQAFGFAELFLLPSTIRFFAPLVIEAQVMIVGLIWAALVLPHALRAALDCYGAPDLEPRIARALHAALSVKPAVIGSAFGVALVAGALLLSRGDASNASILYTGLDGSWFTEPLLPKAAIGLTWAALLGALAFVGSHGLAVVLRATAMLADGEVVDRPAYVMPRLRRWLVFTQLVAFAWSAYLLLFYVATFGHPGPFSTAVVAVATSILIAALLYPHAAFHMTLVRMVSRVSADVRAAADAALARSASPKERLDIFEHVTAEDHMRTWLYDLQVVATFVTLGPLASGIIGLAGSLGLEGR